MYLTEPDDAERAVLHSIESALRDCYQADPLLRDSDVVLALDHGLLALSQARGYGKGRVVSGDPRLQPVIRSVRALAEAHLGKISPDTPRDRFAAWAALLEQVKRSVERHRMYGLRGYFEFVQDFLTQPDDA